MNEAVPEPGGPRLAILGTRGVPAGHGGFETFAERLALYLVARGWRVTVFCQVEEGNETRTDVWEGVDRVLIPERRSGAAGTVVFDAKATLKALRTEPLQLVLGYNTAVLNLLTRLGGRRIVMNMDGMEWRRGKWTSLQRSWLRVNEAIGARVAQALVADHPEIARYLEAHRSASAITMIPYGADAVTAPTSGIGAQLGLEPHSYLLSVARIEPENSILEIVRAHGLSGTSKRLVVLGRLDPAGNDYHSSVLASASPTCVFPGAIYGRSDVETLRHQAFAYLHGHTVGGTNPSLVEAMGAGNPVVAHDNVYNRWVAGDGALYFSDTQSMARALQRLEAEPALAGQLANANRLRHAETFTWSAVLGQYEALLGQQWSLVPQRQRG